MPAATEAQRLASLEPTSRTVDVEQFCSWSACRMSSCFKACTTVGLTSYRSEGTANIIVRKFSMRSSSLLGYRNGWPIDFLYAYEAIVGSLAMRRTIDRCTCSSSWMSSLSW